MSRRDIEPLLHDVVRAAERILGVVASKSLDDYLLDDDAHDIAERNFITIGEALTYALRTFPELETSLPLARDFIAFRHVLTHGYRTIDHRRVWRIIAEDLPLLLTECRSLLGELPA